MWQICDVAKLRLGMDIRLDRCCLNDALPRDQFRISSQRQIDELRRAGIRKVFFRPRGSRSTSRPRLQQEAPATSGLHLESAVGAPASWTPERLVPPELLETIRNRGISPERKSRLVYEHAREMMKRLYEAPAAENIQACKEAVASITDLVLADDATAANLVRITHHDPYTYTHSVNVGVLSLLLTKSLFRRSEGHDLHELGASFFLHDIGKVNISTRVLNKPGPLDDAELVDIRGHPEQGYRLLKAAGALSEECRTVILQHHERFDGTGYPSRAAGEDIHVYARICSVADVYDALTSERAYKTRMSPFDALRLMRDEMLNHFEKQTFEHFVRLFC